MIIKLFKFHLNLNLIETPLHRASFGSNFEIVKLLLANKASVKVSDQNHRTPLYYAAYNSYESVKAILEKGADINRKNDISLYQACKYGKLKIVKLLLEKGADVNKQNWKNESPLLIEYRINYFVVKLLVEKGAKIKARNESSYTPLLKAAIYGKIKIVKYLVSLRVDLNNSNSDEVYSFCF